MELHVFLRQYTCIRNSRVCRFCGWYSKSYQNQSQATMTKTFKSHIHTRHKLPEQTVQCNHQLYILVLQFLVRGHFSVLTKIFSIKCDFFQVCKTVKKDIDVAKLQNLIHKYVKRFQNDPKYKI